MTTNGQGNWMNFDLPGIDRLFREGRGVLDPTKRSEYYKRAADLFFESAYVIPIYKETSPFVRRRENALAEAPVHVPQHRHVVVEFVGTTPSPTRSGRGGESRKHLVRKQRRKLRC